MNKKNKEIVQPEEFSVNKIFPSSKYVVPIYQRNYAWTKTEIEQLLNDISAVSEDSEVKYYLGSLIVNKIGTDVFEVIDGQQRLTTLYLLLAYLNNVSINGHSLSFEARDKSNKTLQAIFAIEHYQELEKDNGYSDEIVNGYADIVRWFDDNDQLKDDLQKKLDKIVIVRVQVPQNTDLNHYFEIMNTRGEQLEIHEVVKAKIIGKIEDSDKKTADKYKMVAATIWDACAQMDKYVQMCFPVDIRENLFGGTWDEFKQNNFDALSMCFNDETEKNGDSFILRDKLTTPEKPKTTKPKENDEDNNRFESIITFPNFILQVNKAMSTAAKDDEDSLDDNKFIDTLKNRYANSDNAKEFIYNLLKYRYLFDRYIVKREYVGQYKVDGKWSLKKLNATSSEKKPLYKATFSETSDNDGEEKHYISNKQLCLLESCLRITYTSPKTMHWVAKVMQSQGKEIITLLERYCCEKIKDGDYLKKKGFEIERIVFSYLDYLLCRDNYKEQTFTEFQFQFRNSIEHFYPQHPINSADTSEVAELDQFGNLALITVSANSKFSNLPPKVKAEQTNTIEQSPKLMIMAQLLFEDNTWGDEQIKKHGKEMLEKLNKEINKYSDPKDTTSEI